MISLFIFINFAFAQVATSPLEGLSSAYVVESIQQFQKTFPDQDQEILNQLWSKSMGVEDDLFEARIIEKLKKSGFSPENIHYQVTAGVTELEIKDSSVSEKVEIRNPFTGEFFIQKKTFFVSDYQRAVDVYAAIYDSYRKTKYTNKQKRIFSSVTYIVLGLIGSQLDSQKCFNDIERAIADIRFARRECVRTYAAVRKGDRAPSSENYLAKTILLKGIGLEQARDPFCMDFVKKIGDRGAKSYFFNKHSCVNNFRSYCRDVIELVNCQSEINILSTAKAKGKIKINNSTAKEEVVD